MGVGGTRSAARLHRVPRVGACHGCGLPCGPLLRSRHWLGAALAVRSPCRTRADRARLRPGRAGPLTSCGILPCDRTASPHASSNCARSTSCRTWPHRPAQHRLASAGTEAAWLGSVVACPRYGFVFGCIELAWFARASDLRLFTGACMPASHSRSSVRPRRPRRTSRRPRRRSPSSSRWASHAPPCWARCVRRTTMSRAPSTCSCSRRPSDLPSPSYGLVQLRS